MLTAPISSDVPLSTNTLCYEAVQRTLRNAGVAFLRTYLAQAFPADHVEKLKRPFKGEWQALECAAAEARSSGGTTTSVHDDYDLLSVSHFYNLFDAYYEKLFAAAVAKGALESKPNRPKLLGALKAVKDFRDPLSHPVEEDVSVEEALGVLTDVRQILLSLNLRSRADSITGQIAGLVNSGSRAQVHEVICSLPTQDSVYQDFVGRDSVLDQLSLLLEDRFTKRCLIAGDGGKGKSAVAYRFAQKVAGSNSYFSMIVWISAKKRRFEAGHIVEIDLPDFHDLPSAIDRLLEQYGPVNGNMDIAAKRQLLLECLDDFPTLIIADDIDSLLDDAAVVSFFTFDIPNTASKVLLTSRRDIPGIPSVAISGFSVAEADLFIASRISTYRLQSDLFTGEVIRSIREACDGSPLYIDDLMRLCCVTEPKRAAQVWLEKRGDEARKYALQREFEKLSVDAKNALIAAVVSDHPASFAELQTVLNFSDDRLISALTELHTLFLLPDASLVEGEQRYNLNSNTRRLILSLERTTDIFARLRAKSKAVSGTLPPVGKNIIGQLIRQALLFTRGGRFEVGEDILLKAIERYPNAADLYGFLGYLYKTVHRRTDARMQFELAAKFKSRSEDTYMHWYRMEMASREYSHAARAAEVGRSALPGSYKLALAHIESRFRVAKDFDGRAQRERAEKIFLEVATEIEKILKPKHILRHDEAEINSALLRILVVSLDRLGDLSELNKRFAQWCTEHRDEPTIPAHRELFARRRGNLFRG